MIRTLVSLALLSCVACSTVSDDDRLVVRSAAVDGDITSYDVALDGARRVVAVVELDDGARIITIADAAGDLLALAKTDDEVLVEYDLATIADDEIAVCDEQCAPLDEVERELLDLALDGTLDAAVTFRVGSSAGKKNDDATQAIIDKIG